MHLHKLSEIQRRRNHRSPIRLMLSSGDENHQMRASLRGVKCSMFNPDKRPNIQASQNSSLILVQKLMSLPAANQEDFSVSDQEFIRQMDSTEPRLSPDLPELPS